MVYSIGKVTQLTGIPVDTLRYYERIGLLADVPRNSGGQRRYTDREIDRLRFISRAKTMDFSLEEIAGLLQLRDAPQDVRSEVRGMTQQKLDTIETRINELCQLRDELQSLVEQCRAAEGCCPILEHFAGEQYELRDRG